MNTMVLRFYLLCILLFCFLAIPVFGEDIVPERMESSVINSILSAPDGGYLLSGNRFGVPWISRNKADGSIEWIQSFPEYLTGDFSGAAFAENGSVLVWGTYRYEIGENDFTQEALAVCLKSDGTVRWSETFSANIINEPLLAIPDGRQWTLFSASCYNYPADHKDLNIVRFDARGNIKDQSTLVSDRWLDFPRAGSFGDGEASFVIFLKRSGLQGRPFEETDENGNWETFLDADPFLYEPLESGNIYIPRIGFDLAFMTMDGQGDILIYDEYPADVDAVYDFAAVDGTWVAVAARYFENHIQHTGGIDVEFTEEADVLVLPQGSGNGDASAGMEFGADPADEEFIGSRVLNLESDFYGSVAVEEFFLEMDDRIIYRWWRWSPPSERLRNAGILLLSGNNSGRFARFGGEWIAY